MDLEVQKAMRVIARAGPVEVAKMLELFPILRHDADALHRRGFAVDEFKLSYAIEEKNEWGKWMDEIPYIPFPAGWTIKMRPPAVGAIVRFNVQIEDNAVSVYLDCYDRLGCYGSPYWEVYPYANDVGRCDMADVNELLRMIGEGLADE